MEEKQKNEIGRCFALILQLGISVLVPIFLCLAVGVWLEASLGSWCTGVFLLLGFLAGGRNAWVLAKRTIDSMQTRKKPQYDLMAGWESAGRKTQTSETGTSKTQEKNEERDSAQR